MKNIKYIFWISLLLSSPTFAWEWMDLWQTPDQRGSQLLKSGKAQEASLVFNDKNWQAVSHYRYGNYQKAYQLFSANQTSDGQYNAGNAAAFMGRYQEALHAYDKAIALNPNHRDAITNREVIKKLIQQSKQQQQNKDNSNDNKNNNIKSAQKNQRENNNSQKNSPEKNLQKNTSISSSQASINDKSKQDQTKDPFANNELNQKSNQRSIAAIKQMRQEENNKQLLSRLADESGGLLQKKFLRDYERRHGMESN